MTKRVKRRAKKINLLRARKYPEGTKKGTEGYATINGTIFTMRASKERKPTPETAEEFVKESENGKDTNY